MKICSLIPSATEILFALGLGDSVAGVTHECDYPAEARGKRIVLRSRLAHPNGSGEIDRQVSEAVARGESLYEVDDAALREIQPDLIVTQDLCHVCAASPGDLASVLPTLPRAPRVVTLAPHSLADVWSDIRAIGVAADCEQQAARLAKQFESSVAQVEETATPLAPRPRVVCLEWLDPPFVAGHWLPEMIQIAGGTDVLGQAGEKSRRVRWDEIITARPDVMLVAPCGFNLAGAVAEFRKLAPPPGWNNLPAVHNGLVYALDANSYTSRAGPRLAMGTWILAALLHPKKFTLSFPPNTVEALAG